MGTIFITVGSGIAAVLLAVLTVLGLVSSQSQTPSAVNQPLVTYGVR